MRKAYLKRILSLILACMMFINAPLSVLAAEGVSVDDFIILDDVQSEEEGLFFDETATVTDNEGTEELFEDWGDELIIDEGDWETGSPEEETEAVAETELEEVQETEPVSEAETEALSEEETEPQTDGILEEEVLLIEEEESVELDSQELASPGDVENPGSAKVRFSLTDDAYYVESIYAPGGLMAGVEMTVPYFDLANYGMDYYYYYDEDGNVYSQPTMLHMIICALEIYKFGVDPEKVGQGYLLENNLIGSEELTFSGGAGSFFMNQFWGHDCNLRYDVNGQYPLEYSGWGATADHILLEDGDYVNLAMFTSWAFFSDSNVGFRYFAKDRVDGLTFSYEALTGEPLEIMYVRAIEDVTSGAATTYELSDATVYYGTELFGNALDEVDTSGGYAEVTFTEPGTYYLWAEGQYGLENPQDIVTPPAYAKVTVTGNQTNALEEAKTAAKAALDTYKNTADYREAQQAELAELIAEGKAAIDLAADEETVASALAAAKASMDAVKTDAQLTEEEKNTVANPGSARVTFSLSEDDKYLSSEMTGDLMAGVPIEIEYFDLAEYGLEDYYYRNAEGYINSQPTLLHLYLYAVEVYYCGVEPSEAGKGYLYDEGLLGTEIMRVSGGAGSFFMDQFWGHDCNLRYYVNGAYPLQSPGWGATADIIALQDGDFVDVAMFTDWSFYMDSNNGFRYFADANGNLVHSYEVMAGEELQVNYVNAYVDDQRNTYYEGKEATICYGTELDGGDFQTVEADEDGVALLSFAEAGTYYLWVDGQYGYDYPDAIVSSPAYAKVTVSRNPAAEQAAALAAAKTAAKAELDSYKNAADYREAQQAELAELIAAGKVAIDAAADADAVASALAAAKASMDAVKTDAQLDAEEAAAEAEALAAALAAAKTAAKAELDSYKNTADYREAQKAELAELIAAGKAAIDAAEAQETVASALAAAKASMDKVKTDAQLKAEEAAAHVHSWGTGTVTKAATCKETGVRTYTCSCKQTKTEIIPKSATHSYGSWATVSEATVWAAEAQKRTCTVCGAEESKNTGKALTPVLEMEGKLTSLNIKKGKTVKVALTMAKGDTVSSVVSSKTGSLKVASVDKKNGKITLKAQKAGTFKLTIKLASGKSRTYTVKVVTGNVKTTGLSVTSVTNNKLTLAVKKSHTLKYELKPFTSTQKVTFKSSNKKIAKVSSGGKITAVAPGKATITVTSGSKKVKITVTVPGITNVKTSVSVKRNKTLTLKPKTFGISGKVTYTSSDTKIATVDKNGKIKGIKKGKANITVKAGSFTKKVTVTVK